MQVKLGMWRMRDGGLAGWAAEWTLGEPLRYIGPNPLKEGGEK